MKDIPNGIPPQSSQLLNFELLLVVQLKHIFAKVDENIESLKQY